MSKFFSEASALTKLALPVSLAQLAMMGMSATDVIIAGRASTTDLAGMTLGANTWNLISLFFMGISFATQPLIAKTFGANNEKGVKHQLHQSIWMCFGLGFIAMFFVWFVAWLMQFSSYAPDMLSVARNYLFVIGLSALPIVMLGALRGTLEGMSLTRIVFYINLGAFIINIPVDYVLVNGLYGMPKLGGVGCALATTILVWLMFGACVLVLKYHHRLRSLNLFKDFQRPHRETILKTAQLGFPIGMSIVMLVHML